MNLKHGLVASLRSQVSRKFFFSFFFRFLYLGWPGLLEAQISTALLTWLAWLFWLVWLAWLAWLVGLAWLYYGLRWLLDL